MAEEKKEEKQSKQIIFVTGANKGIGLELCKWLIKHETVQVIVGCRNFQYVPKSKDPNNKKEAANYEVVSGDSNKTRIQILRDVRFKDVKNVDFVEVDITNQESCKNAAKTIKEKYNKIDILVNNAGIAWKGNAFDVNVVNGTLNVNYYGTKNITNEVLPLLNDNGRIIMTSSTSGVISRTITDKNIENKLLSSSLTINELENDILKPFIDAVKKDKSLKNTPYKQSAYGMSKIAMSAYSRILANDKTLIDRKIWVAAYCPGYCHTYMSSGRGNRTAANGAKGLELLCVNKFEYQQSGKFWNVTFNDDKNDNDTAKLVNAQWTK